MEKTNRKTEFGDFQTPRNVAEKVCAMLADRNVRPATIVEPTCGRGNFLIAALDRFPETEQAVGLDIDPHYVDELRQRLRRRNDLHKVRVICGSFFEANWPEILRRAAEPLLVIGNPPWVTNAELGVLQSRNLPRKSNDARHGGLDAMTGKSNFDISEWMLLRVAEWLDRKEGTLAMLCKTSVARRILLHLWKRSFSVEEASIYLVDAQAHFDAAVEACLLFCCFAPSRRSCDAAVYASLSEKTGRHTIGYRDGQLVADVQTYQRWKHLQGESPYAWRSGIKHDCAQVMELKKEGNRYRNGRGEIVELEDDYLFPMLKSSQVARGDVPEPNRWMLVTQKSIGQSTHEIRHSAPKTWQYLQSHADLLDRRRSSIYRNRPRFAVFGVGDYSFAPWKVAISGFYKKLCFTVIGRHEGKPVVLDDTSYFLSCETEAEATIIASMLNSEVAGRFFSAFIFWDAKRPITIDVLRRLDLRVLAREVDLDSEFRRVLTDKSGDLFMQKSLFV